MQKRKNRSVISNVLDPPRGGLFLLSGLTAIGYFLFSFRSQGVLSDDEISHYYSCLKFFREPGSIVSYWARPGYKIVFALPALLGHHVLMFCMALTSAFTAYFSARAAQCYGIKNHVLSFVFVASAPLFFQMSFRPYTELFAAFLIALLLYCYARERFLFVALIGSFLFTVRQECAVIAVLLAVLFLFQRRYRLLPVLAVFPIVLGVLGYLKTGHPLWIVNDYMQLGRVGRFEGLQKRGFWHYPKMYTAVFGTIPGALALVGALGAAGDKRVRGLWAHIVKYHVLYLIGLSIFLLQSVMTTDLVRSPSPGKLTYVVSIVSVVGIFANLGWNALWAGTRSDLVRGGAVLAGMLALVFFKLSFAHNHFEYLADHDYAALTALSIFILGMAGFLRYGRKAAGAVLFTCCLTVGHTLYAEKPLKPSAEHQAVASIVEWHKGLEGKGVSERVTLVNHVYFYYKRGVKPSEEGYKHLTMETLQEAPQGALVIWDSRYGFNPTYNWDVPLSALRDHPESYLLIRQVDATDPESGLVRFSMIVFGKL